MLKNADLTGFTDEFSSVAAYERIDRATLQRRLLLALFALGTNMGIRVIVATGEHGESEAALRHIRRHFITVDNLCAAVTKLATATFAARERLAPDPAHQRGRARRGSTARWRLPGARTRSSLL
ncbi:Tn3 family transposase [Streptomyces tricolor]|uniref:Tn3 family transposase n=1 Tax=Streptomyces tricolor TaxID=68277 RepID=UPI0036DFFE97